jgi:predicted nucleic acid-binding protein
MRYVLDASVAVKWVIAEPDTSQALRLRDGFLNGLCELIASDVFAAEIAHALTRAERQKRIAIGDAATFLVDVVTDLPRLQASLPLFTRAVELSSQCRIGVYDCLHIALAEREGCPLVTVDGRLVRTFPGGSVVPLSNL